MIHEHVLGGCTPTPLAHYLKALGVLRLLAEQRDPGAAGRWQGEEFVLRTALAAEELESFLLNDYEPTPIVAPWNGGSGFYPTDNTSGIDAIRSAAAPRLQAYRQILALAAAQLGGRQESPKEEEKSSLLVRLRGELPDAVLPWFDAAVMLLSDRPGYPPLLGTGGNDGRLDFTNNFMQRLVEVIDPADGSPRPQAAPWLRGALYGTPIGGLVAHSIGQFAPGNVGGPNASTGFTAKSIINPWDFILMLEGALLFAGTAARRLESADSSALSYPLTVRTTGAGSGSSALADEAPSRAEIWLPLWPRPIGLAEAQALFAEGRVTLGRRPVRDGLEFVRALGCYGADRGISAFQRFGFLMRSGKAYLAAPLGRTAVRRNPKADLLNQLDRSNWLDRLRTFARGKNTPGRFKGWSRRLEDALFALSQHGQGSELQRILILIGQLHQACATSNKARESVPPLPPLGAEWALEADDRTDEFRIAGALAGLPEMRRFVLPVDSNWSKPGWDPGSPLALWQGGDLVGNLVRVLRRRLLEARTENQANRTAAPLGGPCGADLAAVTAFLHGFTDDRRIAALLGGLVHVASPRALPAREAKPETPPACYTLLKPLFTPQHALHTARLLPPEGRLPVPDELLALLASGHSAQIERAHAIAWRRLRAASLHLPRHPRRPPAAIGVSGPRLAAALMITLAPRDLYRVLSAFAPDSQPASVNQEKED